MPTKTSSKRSSTASSKRNIPKEALSTDDLWLEAETIALPQSYWVGQQLQTDILPDNILLFPVRQRMLARSMGTAHPRFVLDIATSATGKLRIGEYNYLLLKNECALIFPHQFNYGSIAQNPNKLGWITITFDLPDTTRIEALRNRPRKLRPSDLLILQQVIHAYKKKSPLAITFYLSELLQQLCEAPEISKKQCNLPSDNPHRDELLTKINHFLSKNIEKAFTIKHLAEEFNLTIPQLQALFRKHVPHTTLGKYIRSRKIMHAARLIQTTNGNMTEIAQRVGFSSLNVFSRIFKKTYGISPKQYEREAMRTTSLPPNITLDHKPR